MINKKTFSVLGTIAAITILTPWLGESKANSQSFFSPDTKLLSQLTASSGGEITQESSIEGTWRLLITPVSGETFPPFYSYLTYHRTYKGGGTLIESSSDPNVSGHIGQGVWERTAKDGFKSTFETFIFFNPLTQENGMFVSKVNETIKLVGDSYMGVAQTSICEASGQKCQTLGSGKSVGNRLKVD